MFSLKMETEQKKKKFSPKITFVTVGKNRKNIYLGFSMFNIMYINHILWTLR